jgi:hypothetical protein
MLTLLTDYLNHFYLSTTPQTIHSLLPLFESSLKISLADGTFPSKSDYSLLDLDVDSLLAHLSQYVIADLLDRSICSALANNLTPVTSVNSRRLDLIEKALSHLNPFLERSKLFLPELAAFLSSSTPGTAEFRQQKIARHQKLLCLAPALQHFVFYAKQGSDALLLEGALRKVSEYFAIEAVNKQRLLQEERHFLEAHVTSGIEHDHRTKENTTRAYMIQLNDNMPYHVDNNRKLFSHASLDSRTREGIKQGVFRPDVALPSMSLDEFARREMQTIAKQKEQAKTSKVYEATEEEQEKKAREWDDWKDLNPKGSGNRGGNRG